MKLIDNILFPFFRSLIMLPLQWIRSIQIHDHTPDTIHSATSRIGISKLNYFSVPRDLIIIINAMQISLCLVAPDSPLFFLHSNFLKALTMLSISIQSQLHFFCQRAPQVECSSRLRTQSSQILSIVLILFLEL